MPGIATRKDWDRKSARDAPRPRRCPQPRRPPPRTRSARGNRPAPAPFRRAPRLERLDDRTLPSVTRLLALGADAGGLPQVRLIDPATGQQQSSIHAYDPAFRGGVRVVLGDVNGDGIPDIVTGA